MHGVLQDAVAQAGFIGGTCVQWAPRHSSGADGTALTAAQRPLQPSGRVPQPQERPPECRRGQRGMRHAMQSEQHRPASAGRGGGQPGGRSASSPTNANLAAVLARPAAHAHAGCLTEPPAGYPAAQEPPEHPQQRRGPLRSAQAPLHSPARTRESRMHALRAAAAARVLQVPPAPTIPALCPHSPCS